METQDPATAIMSPQPPGAQELTLDQFLQQEEQWHRDIEQKLAELYKKKIADLLVSEANYQKNDAENIAGEMVYDGVELMENADSEFGSDDEGDDPIEKANQIKDEFGELLAKSFLLISAPTGTKKKIPIEQDRRNRKLQYENFANVHPALRQDSPKSEKKCCEVVTYTEMTAHTEKFFQGYSSRSMETIIIFNGHGGPNGLCLEGLEGEPNEVIPLDRYMDDLQDIYKKTRTKTDIGLPGSVQLVYAQCHGHLHSEVDSESSDFSFDVVHFTDETTKTTPYTIRRDPLTKDVVDSRHPKLEGWAEKEKETYDVKLEHSKYEEYQKMLKEKSEVSTSSGNDVTTRLSGLTLEGGGLTPNDSSSYILAYESASEFSGFETEAGPRIAQGNETSDSVMDPSISREEDDVPMFSLELGEDTVDSGCQSNVVSSESVKPSVLIAQPSTELDLVEGKHVGLLSAEDNTRAESNTDTANFTQTVDCTQNMPSTEQPENAGDDNNDICEDENSNIGESCVVVGLQNPSTCTDHDNIGSGDELLIGNPNIKTGESKMWAQVETVVNQSTS